MTEASRLQNQRVNDRQKETHYSLGDQVMFWTEKISTTNVNNNVVSNHLCYHKMVPKWIGPCTITGILSNDIYLIHNPRVQAFEVTAHVQFLKHFDNTVDYRREPPPLTDVIQTPDLLISPPSISAHDVFDHNFHRRVHREDDKTIPQTPPHFSPKATPSDDPRIGRYFKLTEPNQTPLLHRTFYINYRNDLNAEAIWFAPMFRDDQNEWQTGGPTRFCSLYEYDRHFHAHSQAQPFT